MRPLLFALVLVGVFLALVQTGESASPVLLSARETVRMNQDANMVTRLRAKHMAQTRTEADARASAQKAMVNKLTVLHQAVPVPDAYDQLEQVVLKAKAARAQKLESMRMRKVARASLRKGGMDEVQELVTVLPPASGPVGRLGHPEKLFGDRVLDDSQ